MPLLKLRVHIYALELYLRRISYGTNAVDADPADSMSLSQTHAVGYIHQQVSSISGPHSFSP
jgi:hypothetical protein